MDSFKVFLPIILIWTPVFLITGAIKFNERFEYIEKDIVKIKTTLILKDPTMGRIFTEEEKK